MKLIKISIVVLIIATLILSAVVIFFNMRNNEDDVVNGGGTSTDLQENVFALVTDRDEFYLVKNIILRYLARIERIHDAELEEELRQSEREMAYNMLSDRYTREFNIDVDNIETQVFSFTEKDSANVGRILYAYLTADVKLYYISATIMNTEETNELNFLVKIDYNNETFSIYLNNYLERNDYQDIEIGDRITFDTGSIEDRVYNRYFETSVDDEELMIDYFNMFANYARYDIQRAFNLLDQEYRELRFTSVGEFESFINRNIARMNERNLDDYWIFEYDDHTMYVMRDTYGNYYIFKATSVMQFTVMLDIHTIDLPQFIERYESVNEAQRMLLNLNRVMQAINAGDYRFAYNRLSEGFRNSNFSTLESFEAYMRNTLFTNNEMRPIQFRNEGNILIYRVEITDRDNENAQPVVKTFIMRLGQGTDFEMSFERI